MAEHGGGSSLMGLTPEEAAREHESQAEAHLARGDPDAALHALNKAIFLCPLSTALYARRAQVYCDLCDVKSAMASYRKLLSIDKNPSQRIKDQFAALLDLHAYSLLTLNETPAITIAYLTEALQLNALEETYWLHRALAFIQANALDKALKDVDHCICLNSADVEYFVLRAKLHWRLHMHDRANSDILRASRLMPDHPEVVEHEQRLLRKSQAIFDLACKELVARHYAEAIEQLTKAIEISPEEQRFYLLRASAKRELGEYHAALKDAEKALSCHEHKLAISRQNQPVYAHTQYQRTHAPDTSKEYWEIATQRNLILNDIALRFLRERAFQLALNAMNQTIRGEMELKDVFRDQIVNPQFFVNRGDAYRGLGNFQAALADYHHALELLPGKQDIQSRIALVHYQFGIELFNRALFDKAQIEFTRAIAHDDNVAAYYARRGDAARYLEQHQLAVNDYRQALQLNPSDEEIKSKLLMYSVDDPVARGNNRLQLELPSKAARSPTNHADAVDKAKRAYERKNKRVQELFLNRPDLLHR